jgi:hypothetical protein
VARSISVALKRLVAQKGNGSVPKEKVLESPENFWVLDRIASIAFPRALFESYVKLTFPVGRPPPSGAATVEVKVRLPGSVSVGLLDVRVVALGNGGGGCVDWALAYNGATINRQITDVRLVNCSWKFLIESPPFPPLHRPTY